MSGSVFVGGVIIIIVWAFIALISMFFFLNCYLFCGLFCCASEEFKKIG